LREDLDRVFGVDAVFRCRRTTEVDALVLVGVRLGSAAARRLLVDVAFSQITSLSIISERLGHV
jgi:hypothetical protein